VNKKMMKVEPSSFFCACTERSEVWTLADDFRTFNWLEILPAYDFNLSQIGALLQV